MCDGRTPKGSQPSRPDQPAESLLRRQGRDRRPSPGSVTRSSSFGTSWPSTLTAYSPTCPAQDTTVLIDSPAGTLHVCLDGPGTPPVRAVGRRLVIGARR